MRVKMTTERWKRHENTGKEYTFLENIHLYEQRPPNMLLPQGQTAPCDLLKQCRVLGISVQVEESRGGGEEKESVDVRRRKHNRNINRKGLRSASCYIWRWLHVPGPGEQREINRFAPLPPLATRQPLKTKSSQRRLLFFLLNVTMRIS